MFRQENLGSSEAPSTSSQPKVQKTEGKKSRKKLYALVAGLIVIVVLVAALLVAQGSGSTIQLGLNYTVGERMVYGTTNVVTNQQYNTSINVGGTPSSESINTTAILDVLSFNGENYTINETIAGTLLGKPLTLPLTVNVSKASYYNNLIAPGGPAIFYNVSSNPTISAYVAKTAVNVGDIWQIPVKIGNSSLGVTGQIALKFVGIQEITVPAGTYKVFRIDISSNDLVTHINLQNDILGLNNVSNFTTRMNGQTYLEYGTCRLIKADLQQDSTYQLNGINGTSSIHTEKILVQHTTP